MFSVGTTKRDILFETVASKINSPIAKIVSFAIKSYYSSLNIKDLESLFKDTEGNYIAHCILRLYVRKYLYTNSIERTKRERMIQIAGFEKTNPILLQRRPQKINSL